jgi:hypothetical protein
MKKYIILLTIAITLILGSCNSDGNGIFFQISQEVKQITSEISELSVHQVVEADGKVYARTGRKVWEQSVTTWTDVSDGNFIYNIVEYNDGTSNLYGNINNDDVNLNGGKIMSYNGSVWSTVDNYNANITFFEADDNYILVNGTDVLYSTFDVSSTSFNSNNTSSNLILDGASSGTEDLLISSNKIYGIDFASNLAEQANPASFSGTYTGLATTGSDIYMTTSTGQIFYGTTVLWTLAGTITDDAPVMGALEVVTIDATDYLIIGTVNGYYEMEIGTTTINSPTSTTSILDFATSYPDLSTALVYEVYQSAAGITGSYFYLATSNGLWKRLADGTFEKQ